MDLVDGKPVVVAAPLEKHSHDIPQHQPIATPVRSECSASIGHQQSGGQEQECPGTPSVSEPQTPTTETIPEPVPTCEKNEVDQPAQATASDPATGESSRKAGPSCMQPLYIPVYVDFKSCIYTDLCRFPTI